MCFDELLGLMIKQSLMFCSLLDFLEWCYLDKELVAVIIIIISSSSSSSIISIIIIIIIAFCFVLL